MMPLLRAHTPEIGPIVACIMKVDMPMKSELDTHDLICLSSQ